MQTTVVRVAAVLAALAPVSFAADSNGQNAEQIRIAGKKPFESSQGQSGSKTSSTQILYHGGPVMNISNSVYAIYYGTFPSTTEPIIDDFLVGVSGSGQYGVNNTYYDQTGVKVPLTYAFVPPSKQHAGNPNGSVYWDTGYSQGTQLASKDIASIVSHAIANRLPANQNGVYLVITAPDVKISGFCTSFCAYHTSSSTVYAGMRIRYALIPDPTQKCSGCNGGIAVYRDTVTPNGDMGADTMTDDIIHELSETVTDPDISAWYTQNGAENGDLCNYVYDTTPSSGLVQTDKNGAHYNATLNGRNFLIQLIWKNSGAGSCAAQ